MSELRVYGINDPEVGYEYEMYKVSEVNKVLAEKDAEIRRLKRALYRACANWADVVAFEETEGIGHDNSVAERWRKMEQNCLVKVEEYK